MDLVDELLLKHAEVPYDPAKRREYYLKTRELKGRVAKKAAKPSPKGAGAAKAALPRKLTARDIKYIKAVTNDRAKVEARRKSIEARVKVLNEKLDRLREVLKGLKQEADKKDPQKSKETKDTKKQDRKELTTTQKKEAAEKAKETRQKEAKASPDKRLQEVVKKIDEVQKQIQEARQKLQKSQANKAVAPRKLTANDVKYIKAVTANKERK